MRTPAFKEWAAIVRALLAGEQILDVRKGGIREDGRHFAVQATRVWLYPTTEHQHPELLKSAYRRWIDEREPNIADGSMRFDGWADIVRVARLADRDELAKLESKLIWTSEYAERRLSWKQRDPLWILAMRAYRLDEPFTVPWRTEYAGCSSWVDVEGLPDDPATLPSEPALTDESFGARLEVIERALGRELEPPGQADRTDRAGR